MAPDRHLDEEEIERYSLGHIAASELDRLEEHLLLCASCQERVEASDLFTGCMREAAAQVRRDPEAVPRRWSMPSVVLATAAVVVLLAAIWTLRRTPPPVAVALAATRGSAAGTPAPAGTPLVLQLDVTGLSATSFRVQMVDETGRSVWAGKFPGASVPPRAAGIYFVRLYSPAGELLREYGLEIGPR
jgi:hypothetical protein